METKKILDVSEVSKTFGTLEVLKNISFHVERGEVVSVIGPSGSGKSTLLRIINQLETADSGSVYKEWWWNQARRKLFFLPKIPAHSSF